MTRIKICGITRAADAELAASLGAWAVGFVFWPRSPRAVDVATARRIVRDLPAFVTAVGVFVDQPPEHVDAVAREVGLGLVQLHGSEPPEYLDALHARAMKASTLADADALDRWPARVTVLLDAHDPVRRGGTGTAIDWTHAAAVARRRPIVLAGGLGPENVADALRIVAPAAIDVSSGVESAPGIKDAERMRALFDAVARAEVVS